MVGLTSSINSIDLPLSGDESSKRSLGACWSIIWLNRFHSKRKIRKIVIDAKAFQVSSRPTKRDAAPIVGLLMGSLWGRGVSRTPSSWFAGLFFSTCKVDNPLIWVFTGILQHCSFWVFESRSKGNHGVLVRFSISSLPFMTSFLYDGFDGTLARLL